ncbi:MAG: hypothetical protein EA427_01105 [Spirochaetaceae bacterium]|nr:MAG: hypothetical protein EA427_01105 [Spirochaetaceae bacterium]
MIHQVSSALTAEGFLLRYQDREYRVSWPAGVWERTPEAMRLFLRDNLAYAMTMHLPMTVPGLSGLAYDSARPLLEPWFFQNFLRDLPSCVEMEGGSAPDETIRFLSGDYTFTDEEIRLPPGAPAANAPAAGGTAGDAAPRAIVPMSFGKDSLLTFGLAEELGLRPIIVYVVEPTFSNEERHKLALARAFEKETGHELLVIRHGAGALRGTEFGWGLQSTEYALLMLPFAWTTGASLILFGNEQSAGSSYPDSSGRMTVYPCYDQSHHWTRLIDRITALATGGRVRTGSVIEPLMDMMVQRALAHRYPRYARYQMSCFVEDGSDTVHPDSPWCHNCGICSKMYLLCVAAGIDPAAVGFRESMLTREKRGLFPLLGGSSAFPYARTTLAREEQLFAFYCAARLGSTEELVREFARGPLYREARNREGELRSRFCTLYTPISTPLALRRGVERIFQDELEAYVRRYEDAGGKKGEDSRQ